MSKKQESAQKEVQPEKSAVAWLYDFTQGYRPLYAVSVAAAVLARQMEE